MKTTPRPGAWRPDQHRWGIPAPRHSSTRSGSASSHFVCHGSLKGCSLRPRAQRIATFLSVKAQVCWRTTSAISISVAGCRQRSTEVTQSPNNLTEDLLARLGEALAGTPRSRAFARRRQDPGEPGSPGLEHRPSRRHQAGNGCPGRTASAGSSHPSVLGLRPIQFCAVMVQLIRCPS